MDKKEIASGFFIKKNHKVYKDKIQITEVETQPIILTDYLGDGVYALFDGYGIWLHANDFENPSDRIYLEQSVLKSLNNFVERCSQYKKP